MLRMFGIRKDDIKLFSDIPKEDVNHIRKLHRRKRLKKLKVLGHGLYGCVYEYKDYAIKMLYSKNNRDAEIIKELHHLGYFPKLYAIINDDLIISERVKGYTVEYYVENSIDVSLDNSVSEQWDNALIDIIKNGYSPHDLHEENVMICEKTLSFKIVDVGCFSRPLDDYYNSLELMKEDCGYISAQSMAGSAIRALIHNKENEIEKHKIA